MNLFKFISHLPTDVAVVVAVAAAAAVAAVLNIFGWL